MAGPILATTDGGLIRVRNPASGEAVEFPHGHRAARTLEFNAGSRHLLTTGPGEPIKVWDAPSGRLVATVTGEQLPIANGRLLLSPDARRLLRFSEVEERPTTYPTSTTLVWDVEHDREQARFASPLYSVTNARFSPDGRCLAIVFWDVVRVWDLATGRETHALRGHTGFVRGIAFAPEGRRLASIGMDNTVRVWDVSPSEE